MIAAGGEPAPTGREDRRKLRLLMVDHDPAATDGLEGWLRERPEVELVHHRSVKETLVGSPCEEYDLCLIDEGAGAIDGVTIGAMILEISPASRMVLVSGAITPKVRQQALEHGFRGVLAKPVAPSVLSMLVSA